ncbi:O-antigen ligase family protein [Marinobacter manganoxydans]|uniref:O-antigen polymerase n=1 Tax=Marinobacter manganoxydans MnI7-9 TaxID=1094979 RepID=G6YRK8_9GAMM|nr:O-antigen ligase family protein [Marinobacter manganoxydans]EHJ05139.1 O-antigen polymerase [Marinobacter manganoxydans MnI7-9]
MGRLLLYVLIFGAGASLLFAPWIAGLAYVANSLLQPQYIWHWIFHGIPIFRITAGLAILGLLFSIAQKKANLVVYKDKQNFIILIIWAWMHLSHYFSPYKGMPASVSPELVLSTFNSIVIMYFVMIPLFVNEKALKYLCYTFVAVGIYYVYWANSAYINQEWHKFFNNRLVGPSQSPYQDANVLSTLIVMCLPFIILLFFRVKSPIQKAGIILVVPLAWHAMVLFSSRAALLASLISFLPLAYVLRSRKANIVIAMSFILFLFYQGSMLLDRATGTLESATVNAEEPINPRLVSWEAGLKLIPEYPIFGAGVQMFEAATSNHFPGKTPHVAHNTFINFAANTGLITGVLFLTLIYLAFSRLRFARKKKLSLNDNCVFALTASSISIIGFFICSIFLDLIIYEPFYIALIINLISYNNLVGRDFNVIKK